MAGLQDAATPCPSLGWEDSTSGCATPVQRGWEGERLDRKCRRASDQPDAFGVAPTGF